MLESDRSIQYNKVRRLCNAMAPGKNFLRHKISRNRFHQIYLSSYNIQTASVCIGPSLKAACLGSKMIIARDAVVTAQRHSRSDNVQKPND